MPSVLKVRPKGAATDCLENPVNCPHCGQKWLGKAAVKTPALYPAFSFVLEKGSKSTENLPTKLPHSTLRSTVIHANIFILAVPF